MKYNRVPSKEACYGCGLLTTLRFLCPCDLLHPMCERCLNDPKVKQEITDSVPGKRATGKE